MNDLCCLPGKGRCTHWHALHFDLITCREDRQRGGRTNRKSEERQIERESGGGGGGGTRGMKANRTERDKGGGGGRMTWNKISCFLSAVHQFVIFLFAQSESPWREGKQSSNTTNVIMGRSERRSYHSPPLQKTQNRTTNSASHPFTCDSRASRHRGVCGTLTVRNRRASVCALTGSKRRRLVMWCMRSVMYKRRKTPTSDCRCGTAGELMMWKLSHRLHHWWISYLFCSCRFTSEVVGRCLMSFKTCCSKLVIN